MATFSVGFDDHPELDEREEARRVAREFGTDHHEMVIASGRPSGVPRPRLPPGRAARRPGLPAAALRLPAGARARRQVVLAGEGADELFWGYPATSRRSALASDGCALLRLPRPIRQALPHLVIGRDRRGYCGGCRGLANGRLLPMHMPLGLPRAQRARVLGDRAGATAVARRPAAAATEALGERWFDTQEYEFGVRLPELLLMRIDRFSMSNSVEARVPFLDPGLVDFAYRLPIEQKLRDGTTKIVLREAVADVVPEWVVNRPKQGFGAPVVSWLQTDFGTILGELIDDPAIGQYFDTGAVRRLVDSGHFGAWSILNFALWHRYWIQGESLDPVLEKAASRSGSAVSG